MLRRLHTRVIGMGAVCGLSPSPPAEVFFKTLPPPQDVDVEKYRRFQREEERSGVSPRLTASPRAPEPFYDIVRAAAGHKHVAMITREGNLITVGDNRYGQTGALHSKDGDERDSDTERTAAAPFSHGDVRAAQRAALSSATDFDPLYIDLGGAFTRMNAGATETGAHVSCGSNFTLVYEKDSRRVIAFGNNGMGQLGVGHKRHIDGVRGFIEWDPMATWWPTERTTVLESLHCGFNHAVARLSNGGLYAFGSNTWGELGVGNSDEPMFPTRIPFFESRGMRVAKVALGNSFSLFLTEEGRVFGCGATNGGQLPPNTFDPVPIPLTRSFQQGGSGEGPGRVGGPPKLIRIKDVACVGSLAAYVSSKNEILLQGSLPEYGVRIPAPRFTVVDQHHALGVFAAHMERTMSTEDLEIVGLVGGPSTLLVRYRNGCVAALGANTEGQLHNVTKELRGQRVNLAPAFHATELFPMFVPATSVWDKAWFVSGKGFNLLFDHNEAYHVPENVSPIELPPGKGIVRHGAYIRQQRLRASLR